MGQVFIVFNECYILVRLFFDFKVFIGIVLVSFSGYNLMFFVRYIDFYLFYFLVV